MFSGKNHQRVLNLQGGRFMRNRISTWSQKFLLTNYVLFVKGKIVNDTVEKLDDILLNCSKWTSIWGKGILLSLDVTLGGHITHIAF